MRIDSLNKVNQLYKTNSAKSAARFQSSSYSDKLEISETGKSYQVAKQILAKTADVRMDKINDIKKRMEAGSYHVTMEDLANKLVENYFDETI